MNIMQFFLGGGEVSKTQYNFEIRYDLMYKTKFAKVLKLKYLQIYSARSPKIVILKGHSHVI